MCLSPGVMHFAVLTQVFLFQVFQFLNAKCESAFLTNRYPRQINWPVLYRRKHKKGFSGSSAGFDVQLVGLWVILILKSCNWSRTCFLCYLLLLQVLQSV